MTDSQLNSMTGFARASGGADGRNWIWELKSVNGKGLEVRCRLPGGMESLESAVRARIAEKCRRGNISATLTVKRDLAQGQYRINEELLRRLADTVNALEAGHLNYQRPSLDILMTVKGVVEASDDETEDEEALRAREALMLADLHHAVDSLRAMRADEGRRLGAVLSNQISEIERLTDEAAKLAEAQPDAIRARLQAQLSDILQASPALPEERLIQEVAILATRADVREELDRLRAHADAARQLVASADSVGRKLDFLCQEFTREANTLCSKAQDVAMTRIGIELKSAVEQFREQVQNIE